MFLNYKTLSVYSKLSRKGWDERRKVESDSGKKKEEERRGNEEEQRMTGEEANGANGHNLLLACVLG